MHRWQAWMLLIATACSAGWRAQAATDTQGDRAIRKVIDQYVQARNNKDAAAVRKLFTSDADQLVSTGEWRKGLDEIVRGTSASSKNEMSRSSITVESIRLLDPEVALVDGRYETTALSGAVRRMRTTFVLKRTPEGWRIAAIRNMLPSQPAKH